MRKVYFIVKKIFEENDFAAGGLVFALASFFFFGVYYKSGSLIFLDDHFFLFKFATLLREQGFGVVKNFDWIFLTDDNFNHVRFSVSLFNIVSIPFTFLTTPILGVKVLDIFFASLSLSLFYYVLRISKIRNAYLFLGIAIINTTLMTRFLSGRAFVLIVSLVFLELYLAIKQKYFKLFAVFTFHVMWHEATFFMPLIVAGVVELSRICDGFKLGYKNFLVGLSGIFLGMTIYPDYPKNIISLAQRIINIHREVFSGNVKIEGQELYTSDLFKYFSASDVSMLLMLVCFFIVIFYFISNRNGRVRKIDPLDDSQMFLYASFYFLLFIFIGGILVSGRFYDFYFPAVIFLSSIVYTKIVKDNFLQVSPFLGKFVIIGLTLFFLIGGKVVFNNQRQMISKNDYTGISLASKWIGERSKNRELVFLTNWSDFAMSFFFNDKNVYTMGAEPRLLLEHNPELYWRWYNMYAYGIYCEKQNDCSEEKKIYDEKLKDAESGEYDKIRKENAKKIFLSIKNDFGSRFILDSGRLKDVLALPDDMVIDSFEYKSKINGSVTRAFELK